MNKREEYALKFKRLQQTLGGEWGAISYHYHLLREHQIAVPNYYFSLRQDAETAYQYAYAAFPFTMKIPSPYKSITNFNTLGWTIEEKLNAAKFLSFSAPVWYLAGRTNGGYTTYPIEILGYAEIKDPNGDLRLGSFTICRIHGFNVCNEPVHVIRAHKKAGEIFAQLTSNSAYIPQDYRFNLPAHPDLGDPNWTPDVHQFGPFPQCDSDLVEAPWYKANSKPVFSV